MKQIKASLTSKMMISPDVCHLCFFVERESLEFSPGQYGILTVPTTPTPLKRLYSFAGTNKEKNKFEFIIKLIPGGISSEYIKSLKVGDLIEVSGPAGLFSQQKNSFRKIYMATGTGFAPIRSFLLSYSSNDLNASLFWGLKDLTETCLLEELLTLKKSNSHFSFTYCLSKQDSLTTIPAELLQYYRLGHIDHVWQDKNLQLDSTDEYYLCGSRTVIESLRLFLLSKGISKEKIFFEKY